MKIRSFQFVFVLCFFAIQFAACKKEVGGSATSLPATAASVAGKFTVNSFVTLSDQTATFNGYNFIFNENGTVTATKNDTISNGTWRFDDSNNTELKLSFADAPLNELNKSWHIAELTTEHMLLTDDDDSEDSNDDHPSSHSKLEFERD